LTSSILFLTNLPVSSIWPIPRCLRYQIFKSNIFSNVHVKQYKKAFGGISNRNL
jgi:hypothetical protein